MEHTILEHKNCQINHCGICDGGLAVCTVCGGAEGSLPSECPGEKMTHNQEQGVYNDGLDYKDGKWVSGPNAR